LNRLGGVAAFLSSESRSPEGMLRYTHAFGCAAAASGELPS
jgi:hypothetical protein